jgi:ribosomal protein S18 acetylase RimI-like enzyme
MRVIEELLAGAREGGCRAARLDTSAYLTAAVALYRSAGYTEVADYNGNAKADLWFERELVR